MNDIKKYNDFLNENMEEFYKDLDDSRKHIKLFVDFESNNSLSYSGKTFKVKSTKKKFKPSVKQFKKQSDKNIF